MNSTVAAQRNADLRLLLQVTWPTVKFSVRNGRQGAARVAWTDGPCPHTVSDLLRTVPAWMPGVLGNHWAVQTNRSVSRELIAASYLRARALRKTYYTEGSAARNTGTMWSCEWENLDADDVDEQHWLGAQIIVSLSPATNRDAEEDARDIAATVFHQGAAVDGALAS